jgi:hypothetical protein
MGVKVKLLEHHCAVLPHKLNAVFVRHLLVIKVYQSGGRDFQAVDTAYGSALTRAGGTEYNNFLALANGKVNVFQNFCFAKRLMYVFQPNHPE